MAGWRLSIGVAFVVASSVLVNDVLAGQTTFGMIAGRVTDSTGAVLPGATVTVANIRTGEYLKYYERQYGRRLNERAPKTKLTGAPANAKRRTASVRNRRELPKSKVRSPKPKRPKVRRAGAGRRAG